MVRSLILGLSICSSTPLRAGDLIIDLGKSKGVTFVGTLLRWDEDGNPRKPIDRKAKIGARKLQLRRSRSQAIAGYSRSYRPAAMTW